MIDDGYIADVHAAGFEYFGEEVQLVVREEGCAGGVDQDGDFPAVVAQGFIGLGCIGSLCRGGCGVGAFAHGCGDVREGCAGSGFCC